MTAQAVFRQKAPVLMRALMAHFPGMKDFHAAAIVGNAGHESGGFTQLREIAYLHSPGIGGYGWFQWTGTRRRMFLAWCAARHMDWRSDQANIGYLMSELNGAYRRCISALLHTGTLEQATESFERTYEAAGVVSMQSRINWARMALAAYRGSK